MQLTETQLDALYRRVYRDLERLHRQSEQGDGGRANILFHALAGFMAQNGILDGLITAASLILEKDGCKGEPSSPKEAVLARTLQEVLSDAREAATEKDLSLSWRIIEAIGPVIDRIATGATTKPVILALAGACASHLEAMEVERQKPKPKAKSAKSRKKGLAIVHSVN